MVTLQILVLPFLVRVRVAQRRKTEPMHICIGSVVFIPHHTYYIQNKGNISLFPIPDADNTLKREELWRSHRKIQVKLNFRSACTIFNACIQTLNKALTTSSSSFGKLKFPSSQPTLSYRVGGKLQINLTLLNFRLAQQRKCKSFLYIHSLKFAFSLGLHYLCANLEKYLLTNNNYLYV